MEFGELIDPETRAFWEDYDEFEAGNRNLENLSWKWMDDELSNDYEVKPFEKFFVIEGKRIFDFINKTTLKNAAPICQLESYKTAIYNFPEQNYVICLTEGNDIDVTAQITELLKPWLEKAAIVVSLSFQAAYSYNTSKEFDKQCFVRTVANTDKSNQLELEFVEPIEDSNIVYGVSAGVSTWRHVHAKPFSCYAIYIDCPAVDSTVASPILKLFNALTIKCDSKYVYKDINNSNLYM